MIHAFIQARMSSTRLPGKVLKKTSGIPLLQLMVQRVQRAKHVSKIVILTSTDASDDALVDWAQTFGVEIFRGDLLNVQKRFQEAALNFPSEHIIRLTGDCPLLDPAVLDDVISLHIKSDADYSSNIHPPTFPDGLDCEIFKSTAFEKVVRESTLSSEKEHVTPYFYKNPQLFKISNFANNEDLSKYSLTVDNPADFELIDAIVKHFTPNIYFSLSDVMNLFKDKPELLNINSNSIRNEGYQKSLLEDKKMNPRYKKSQEMLAESLKYIPLGAQTFSKSITQYPQGISPHFITKGKGSRVWDVDGNEYVDFVSSLSSINIGYADEDVNQAVRDQLEKGSIFSLSSELEIEVAKKMVELIPSAEMVRFGKNGTDATSAAVRLARAATGRDHVAVCGYHGWADWYIGSTTMNRGVPKAVSDLTHSFIYNDIDSLKKIFESYPGQIAAIVLEPMNVFEPKDNFLQKLRDLADEHKSLLVFDETITGFRYALGGAQELFGVTPDLSTFGKGMANGFPISAIVGKSKYMSLMGSIFFSGTFGGDTLSLAAAKAAMDKLQKHGLIEKIKQRGEQLVSGFNSLIKNLNVDFVSLAGHPSWTFMLFKDSGKYTANEVKTYVLQELFQRGFLTIGTHNISASHSQEDVDRLLCAYKEVFATLKTLIADEKLAESILGDVLKPLFKVR